MTNWRRLEAEFGRMAFGDDTAARDAAKREVLAAAGYEVPGPLAVELTDEAW